MNKSLSSRRTLALQQVALLTAIHFVADMLSGTVPGFLPALREKYSLSLSAAALLLALISFSSNGLQIWAGTLRKESRLPKLIQLGLLLCCAVCFVGLIPKTGALVSLFALMLILGAGVALVHPEGLRSVCAIPDRAVSPQTATTSFMLAGFFGAASGPLFSGFLVQHFGLKGLLFLAIPVVVIFIFFYFIPLKLKVERCTQQQKIVAPVARLLTFRQIFIVSTLINTGCCIMQSLLPSFLREQEYSLTFSGFSGMLFGGGAAMGAIIMTLLVRRYPLLKCLTIEIAFGIPVLIAYLFLSEHIWAAALIPLSGILLGAGFPQMVVLARTAPGKLPLGTRMGLIVGGTWSIAGAFLLLAGCIGDYFSLRTALLLSPLFYAAVLVMLFVLGRKLQNESPLHR